MYDLVKTSTKDGLYLNALFRPGPKDNYVVVFVHGFERDFYSQSIIPIISDSLSNNGFSFLSPQLRGTASEKEFEKTDGSTEIIGAHFELLKDAYKDIDAWIEYLIENGYFNIVLVGFSLGCDKVVRYFAEGNQIKFVRKIILTSIFDTHEVARIAADGHIDEILKLAKDKVDRGLGLDLIDSDVFPMRMSNQTLLSRLTKDHFGKMFNFADKDNNFMLLNKLNIPVKVVIGEDDPYISPSTETVKEAVDIIKLNVDNVECAIVENAGHCFVGKEHELAQELIHFLVE